ncbi:uncharacterized protein LOC102801738 isoform X2 [Saccoglossus kowalevskii]|uniref:Uncharacterized protein LOC102801738 n=1 Tax=Saccoglossus kowalevskii TaxID=10224 RepID=A0ABM0MWR3_SACKO|nr:PREDICTED: uncharacterized protein LOC102801738 [Saccoglossus kowalevskii]
MAGIEVGQDTKDAVHCQTVASVDTGTDGLHNPNKEIISEVKCKLCSRVIISTETRYVHNSQVICSVGCFEKLQILCEANRAGSEQIDEGGGTAHVPCQVQDKVEAVYMFPSCDDGRKFNLETKDEIRKLNQDVNTLRGKISLLTSQNEEIIANQERQTHKITRIITELQQRLQQLSIKPDAVLDNILSKIIEETSGRRNQALTVPPLHHEQKDENDKTTLKDSAYFSVKAESLINLESHSNHD